MPQAVPLHEGPYYDVNNRGNNRAPLFLEERNYRYFLKLYAHHVVPTANTYAYCSASARSPATCAR